MKDLGLTMAEPKAQPRSLCAVLDWLTKKSSAFPEPSGLGHPTALAASQIYITTSTLRAKIRQSDRIVVHPA